MPTSRHLIYGYPRRRRWFVNYAVTHKVGLDKDGNPCWDAAFSAAMHIIDRAGVFLAVRLIGVTIKGKIYLCLALASNEPRDRLPMPPQERRDEIIKALQEIIGTDRAPKWCDYE